MQTFTVKDFLRIVCFYGAFLVLIIGRRLFSRNFRQHVKVKPFDNFDDWKKQYRQTIKSLKNELMPHKKKCIIVSIISIILAGCLLYWSVTRGTTRMTVLSIMFIPFICFFIISIVYLFEKAKCRQMVVSCFLAKIAPELSCDFETKKTSKLYEQVYEFDNECGGSIQGNSFEIVNLRAYYHRFAKGDYHPTNSHLVLKCVFANVNLYKKFPTFSIIPRKKHLLGQKDFVETSHSRFEQYFEVHTKDNQEDVKFYLKESLLDYLVSFREKYGIEFDLVFDDQIYIRFYVGAIFSIPLFVKQTDEQSIYKFYCITKFIKDIREIMN